MSIVDTSTALAAIPLVGTAGLYSIGGAVIDAVRDKLSPDIRSIEQHQSQTRAVERAVDMGRSL